MICPVCEASKWKNIYNIGIYKIEECLSCGFAKIDPLPDIKNRRDDYSKDKVIERNIKKKTFLQKFSRFLKQAFSKILNRNKSKIFYDKLQRYIPQGGKILDIGCGDGSFLGLAKNSYISSGIEISEYLADIARGQKDLNIITGNFVTADFSGRKYDGITMISLLEHLHNPKEAIKKCFELLNKNGVILIKTVNYNSLNRIVRGFKWAGFRPPDHVVYFSPNSLKLFLQNAGFRKVKISSWIFNDNMYCEALK